MAPELLQEVPEGKNSHSSQKGDVYSFGIILEEIVMRGGPYEQCSVTMTPKGKIVKEDFMNSFSQQASSPVI